MRARLLLAALTVLPAAPGCSDDDRATVDPCDLLSEADASAVLDGEVERIDFVELFERENGRIPDEDRAEVEATGQKTCSYVAVDGDDLVALQLDPGLFESVEEFRESWDDDVEILDGPGLGSAYDSEGESHSGAISVLLDEAGDSFALLTYHADVSRDDLITAARRSTERYPA